ncbi:quinolinate synthase NadA [bacterium]|nr:quinolinate synthase NadA [bacterium]
MAISTSPAPGHLAAAAASLPASHQHDFSEAQIAAEAACLHERLQHVGWGMLECEMIAPLTLEINKLKAETGSVVLAHSYQTPDIIYGIADHVGDSLALSQAAAKTEAGTIVFCGVRFMAETAKILSPSKKVLLPAPNAGCSLSESITAADVRALKAQHPGAPVVCYVNTSAEVKAECDACCTSANALAVVEAMEGPKVLFVPDKYMAANLRPLSSKEIISWDGDCMVHREFRGPEVRAFRRQYPDAALLAHTECLPEVVAESDMAGSTSGMETYIQQHPERRRFMLITECGMTDKLKAQFPERDFVGTCVLCPHMKRVELRKVLQAMTEPVPEQEIELAPETIARARKAIDAMLSIGRAERVK